MSVSKGEIDLGKDDADDTSDANGDKKDDASLDGLLQTLRSLLQDAVKDVRLSGRLTDSPACLVGDKDDLSPQLEQMMRQMGQSAPKTKRILEINPDHAFVGRLGAIHGQDAKAPGLATYAQLLHGQAILAEGGELPDPGAYSRVVMEVAQLAVGASAEPVAVGNAKASAEPPSEPGAESAAEPEPTATPAGDADTGESPDGEAS